LRAAQFRFSALLLTLGAALAAPSQIVTALPPSVRITYLLPIQPAPEYTVNNGQVSELLYRPLLWVNSRIQIDYARSVASSVTTRDGQHYLIQINPKWHWSDGRPVTAADVAFDADLLRSIGAKQASQYGGWGIGGIPNDLKSVKVLSRYRLEITLKHAYSPTWFIYNGVAQLYPLPKHAWDRYPGHPAKTLAWLQARGDKVSFFRKSPVDGPFQVGTFSPQNYQLLTNPHYSGHRASYHALVLRYFASSDAEFNALKVGQVQVGYLPFHLYAERRISGYRFTTTPSWGFNYLYVNFANPRAAALKDLAVRQALQLAIDQPKMDQALLHGQAVVGYGPVPFEPPTYLSPKLKSGWVPYPYNPAEGKKLLLAHGWKPVGGVMQKGGQRLSFTLDYSSGAASVQQQAEVIAQAAAREDIQIRLAPKPVNTMASEMSSPSAWDLIYFGGGWFFLPDYYPTGYGLFNSKGGSNSGAYSNPEMNRLTELTHAFFKTKAAQLQALYRYEDYAAFQLPLLWMPENKLLNEISAQLVDVNRHINPNSNWSPQYWRYR
jgi:peptide/nickel transport system substrate-binding protein